MKFYASMTMSRSLGRKLLAEWNTVSGEVRENSFRNAICTPLVLHKGDLEFIRELKHKGRIDNLAFDSGGFYVQQDKMSYFEVYGKLLDFYKENQWADLYVLPDHVPNSSDTSEDINKKVQDTISFSKNFFFDLPGGLQEKALPVVQGQSKSQIKLCVENFLEDLQSEYLGFGTFGTSGPNGSVNMLSFSVIENIKYLRALSQEYSFHVHFFGIGGPATAPILHALGAHSCDGSSWQRAAAYGDIYFPFTGTYNITNRRMLKSTRFMNEKVFRRVKDDTDHSCPFCKSYQELRSSKCLRMLHNLSSLLETLSRLEDLEEEKILTMLKKYSSRSFVHYREAIS